MSSFLTEEDKIKFLDFLEFIVSYKVNSIERYKEAVRIYSKTVDVSIEDIILKSAEFISNTMVGFKSTQWPEFNNRKGFDILYKYTPESIKNILKSGNKDSIMYFYSENTTTSSIELKALEDHFKSRLDLHVGLVRKYLKKLLDSNIISKVIYEEEYKHDESKYSEPEKTPYLYINWRYKMKDDGKEYHVPESIMNAMNDATFHHISTNKHHADYWDSDLSINNINPNNRDAPPNKIVDATKMPTPYLASMCADWCAMSEEKGTSPYDWAKNNINIRWKFTKEQESFIYDTLDKIWVKEISLKEKAISILKSNGIEIFNNKIMKKDKNKALLILSALYNQQTVSEKSYDIDSVFNTLSHEAAYAYYMCASIAFESAAEDKDSKSLYNKHEKCLSIAEKHLKLSKNKKLAKKMFDDIENNESSIDMHNDIISGDLTSIKPHPMDKVSKSVLLHHKPVKQDIDDTYGLISEFFSNNTNKFKNEYDKAINEGKSVNFPLNNISKLKTYDYNYNNNTWKAKNLQNHDDLTFNENHTSNNPIIVADVNGDLIVLDGNHRLLQAKKDGKKTIDMFVIKIPMLAEQKVEASSHVIKERVHNQMEAEVLIKEAFVNCDEYKYNGTTFYTHDGDKMFVCIINDNKCTMTFPDGNVKHIIIKQ